MEKPPEWCHKYNINFCQLEVYVGISIIHFVSKKNALYMTPFNVWGILHKSATTPNGV